MSSVISGYSNYSLLTEEQRATGRSFLERHRYQMGAADQNGKTDADAVDFSARSKELAATGALSKEEMEAFSYSHLLQFQTEDGGSISVDLAMDPDSEEKYLAARITVTNADGSEEVLYIPFEAAPPAPPAEAGEAETAETQATTQTTQTGQTAQTAVQAATEEAQPSLLDLIEKYGLNKAADTSDGIFAAIQARIEAMIEAAKETAAEEESLETVKADREDRNAAAGNAAASGTAGTDTAARGFDGVEIGQEINAVSGRTARSLAGYAKASASFTAGMGSFSRRY